MPIANIVFSVMFISVLLVLITPLGNVINTPLKLDLQKSSLSISLIVLLMLLFIISNSIIEILYFIVSIFIVITVLLSFIMKNIYLYVFAIVITTSSILFLVLHLDNIAGSFAALSFYCLVLATLKSIYSIKVIDKNSDV